MILDGGDFVADSGDDLHLERNELMLEAMSIMAYDVVGLGEAELILGLDFLAEAGARLPLVCGNLRLGPDRQHAVPKVRYLERDGRTIGVTGYVDPILYYEQPGALDLPPDSLLVMDPVLTMRPLVEEMREKADLVVVLAHGSLDQVREWLGQVPGVDAVVQGHEPGQSQGASQQDRAYLILSGPRSRRIGDLRFTLNEAGEKTSVSYRLHDLKKQRGQPDHRLEVLVGEFEARYGVDASSEQ